MYCGHCGNYIASGLSFCTVCGSRVWGSVAPTVVKRRSGKPLIVALSVLLVLVSLGVGGYFLLRSGDEPLLSADANSQYVNDNPSILQIYTDSVAQMRQDQIDAYFQRAIEYNAARLLNPETWFDDLTFPEYYDTILSIDGVIGLIQIPAINVELPIYHSSEEGRHTELGANHLMGTAFPIGGYSNHSVIYAYSSIGRRVLFRDLERLVVGDLFFITVLDMRLAYQVVDTMVIYPHEVDHLQALPGEDIVTLLTDYPYRVNSHRLLVRGTRVPYTPGMAD